jgi:Arc/MetJ family transcription regulator
VEDASAQHLTQPGSYYVYNCCIGNMYRGDTNEKDNCGTDEKLLQSAVEAIGAGSKKEAIEAGLKALVRRTNREALRRELGTFDIDLTSDELERSRNAE